MDEADRPPVDLFSRFLCGHLREGWGLKNNLYHLDANKRNVRVGFWGGGAAMFRLMF